MSKNTGGKVLVDQLLLCGVDKAYCVPGESYLGALDALYDARDGIELITCRQEGGAAFMAEAYGKVTGKPGICFVTRGPGATNAAIGVHTAQQDATPMILFIGQVSRDMLGRRAFQEVDYVRMFGDLAKYAVQIDDPARIPEIVCKAYTIANSGRKGPVVIALPEDILTEATEARALRLTIPEPVVPAPSTMDKIVTALNKAARPVMILGGSGWDAQTVEKAGELALGAGIPTVAGFRCQDLIDNENPFYIGELGTSMSADLPAIIQEADLLLVIGEHLGEMSSAGYTLLKQGNPGQAFIHVQPQADELNTVFLADLPVVADAAAFIDALHDRTGELETDKRDSAFAVNARARFEHRLTPRDFGGNVDPAAIMGVLREQLDRTAILTNGAGNYTGWAQRFYRFRSYPTQVAPRSGAMGYGLPAAIAVKSVYRDRDVVCFAGDGCVMMNVQEMATAVQHGLAPIVIILDNGMFGTIRAHQEGRYPERQIATALQNPDFVALATSFGAHAEQVTKTEDFAGAFERARASGRLSVIHIPIDPEMISTSRTLSEIRHS